jgi:hypothetical protein
MHRRTSLLAAVASLALVAGAAPADASTEAALAPVDDVDAFFAAPGVPGSLRGTLEAWHPKARLRAERPLRRIVLSTTVTSGDRPPHDGGPHVLLPLRSHPGYVQVSFGPPGADGQELTWLGLLTLDGRMVTTTSSAAGGHVSRTVLTRIVLPEDFDAALAPGATWRYELAFRSRMRARAASETSGVERELASSRHCTNSARRPASELFAGLGGDMVTVRCTRDDMPDRNWLTFAYVQDEQLFVPLEFHQPLLPRGDVVIDTFAVERIER